MQGGGFSMPHDRAQLHDMLKVGNLCRDVVSGCHMTV
jgi:hypothetical protein